RNSADGAIHSVKKSLTDHGDKLDAAEKEAIEKAVQELEDVVKGDDKEAIESKTNALMEASQKLGEKVYAASQAEGGAAEQGEPQEKTVDAEVVDAEFEEVKDDKK
ncbi:Hsp70 family protein, partial [Hansschlegelia beijingensis]